jgi:hypothetical protein
VREIFSSTTQTYRLYGRTQTCIQRIPGAHSLGVKWRWREANHSPPCSVVAKHVSSSTPSHPCSFIVRTEGAVKLQIKCTLVQTLGLSTGRTAPWGSRGIALLFLDHGTRGGCGVSVTFRPHFTPGKDPVPIVQEAGWAPGPGKSRPPTGIRSPDGPARSQSLYRLSYPVHSGGAVLYRTSVHVRV